MRFLIVFAAAAAMTSPVLAMPAMKSMSGMSMAMPKCKAGNPVVWLNTSSKIYYIAGSAYYGKTKQGKFVCRNTASAMGAHGAVNSHGMMRHGGMMGHRGTMGHGGMMSPRTMMSPGAMSSSGPSDRGQHGPGGAMSSAEPSGPASMASPDAMPTSMRSGVPDRGRRSGLAVAGNIRAVHRPGAESLVVGTSRSRTAWPRRRDTAHELTALTASGGRIHVPAAGFDEIHRNRHNKSAPTTIAGALFCRLLNATTRASTLRKR